MQKILQWGELLHMYGTVYESFRVESLSLGKIHTHVDSLGVLWSVHSIQEIILYNLMDCVNQMIVAVLFSSK